MGAMMEAVQAFFTAGHWPMTEVPGHPLLRLGFASAEGSWNCLAHVREAQSEFLFYSVCPFNVPDPRRATMAEFLTRANYGLALGNFEMDFTDGEVRYKTSIDVQEESLTEALLRPIVYANLAMMKTFLPGLVAVADGTASAEEAYQLVRG